MSIHVCHVAFGHQLYPAEVERAYRGHGARFVLTDGRDRYVAALMLGVEHLLVARLAPPR